MAERYTCIPMPNSLPLEELLFSQQILLSLQSKSANAPLSRDVIENVWETRLTPLTRIAVQCLKYDYKGRATVNQLLEDPFFS